MVKNKKVNKKDMDKEIDEILKISNTETPSQNQDNNITLELKQEENEEIYNDEEDIYVHNIQRGLKEIYNDIKENKIEGIKLNNQIYKIKGINKEQQYVSDTHLFYFDYYLSMEDIKGQEKYIKLNYYYELFDKILIKKIPLLWKIKNFWYRNNPLILFKKYKAKLFLDDEIKEILYLGCDNINNPYKHEYKSSLKDKFKWIEYNLLHCHCSDREEKSCDIDIENMIKNNSYESIKEYEKEKQECREKLKKCATLLNKLDNKYYESEEFIIKNYELIYNDLSELRNRIKELGYDTNSSKSLDNFIKKYEKKIN